MRQYKLLSGVIFMALLTTTSYANRDGFYVGAEVSLIDLGDDTLTITNKDKTTKTYKEVSSFYGDIKVGYQHYKGNRVEFYCRKNKLDSNSGDITTKTYGINYEWAFSSLASENVIPYVLVGFGGGEATSSDIKAIDKADAGEANFGLGIHYKFNENLDLQVGYSHVTTGFDKFDNSTTDETSTIDQDKIAFGVNYKF